MESVLELDEADRRGRIGRMAEVVRNHDVFRWVEDELRDISRGHDRP
jgi:trehalose-6-phosphate synthase